MSQVRLRDAAQEVLPKDVVARTGDELVKKNKAQLDEVLGFLNTFLLVFAGVSLVVGTFLIVNTFSILVAQRSRELALLRALGASRRQVNVSVLVEAVAVGLGSTLGLGAGYLLARGLQLLFGAVGFDLSRAVFPVNVRTVVASYAVGVLVTVVAAYLSGPPRLHDPARRGAAGRRGVAGVHAAPPGARRVRAHRGRRRRDGRRLHQEGNLALTLIGLGMLGILVGVSLLSPWVGRPLTRAFEVGTAAPSAPSARWRRRTPCATPGVRRPPPAP